MSDLFCASLGAGGGVFLCGARIPAQEVNEAGFDNKNGFHTRGEIRAELKIVFI